MVAKCRAAAGCCGVAYETVTTVTSPAYHAVNMAAALRGDRAVERRVWGGAVQRWRGGNKTKHLDLKMTSHRKVHCRPKQEVEC